MGGEEGVMLPTTDGEQVCGKTRGSDSLRIQVMIFDVSVPGGGGVKECNTG